jgi:hypothetical protein
LCSEERYFKADIQCDEYKQKLDDQGEDNPGQYTKSIYKKYLKRRDALEKKMQQAWHEVEKFDDEIAALEKELEKVVAHREHSISRLSQQSAAQRSDTSTLATSSIAANGSNHTQALEEDDDDDLIDGNGKLNMDDEMNDEAINDVRNEYNCEYFFFRISKRITMVSSSHLLCTIQASRPLE